MEHYCKKIVYQNLTKLRYILFQPWNFNLMQKGREEVFQFLCSATISGYIHSWLKAKTTIEITISTANFILASFIQAFSRITLFIYTQNSKICNGNRNWSLNFLKCTNWCNYIFLFTYLFIFRKSVLGFLPLIGIVYAPNLIAFGWIEFL